MVMPLLVSVILFVFPAYAGMCGESDGTVKCTDDVGRNSTLQTLDKALVSPGGVTAPADYSLVNSEMATYPKDTKTVVKPIGSESDSPKESDTTTFITSGEPKTR
jgi:hypothetical protein